MARKKKLQDAGTTPAKSNNPFQAVADALDVAVQAARDGDRDVKERRGPKDIFEEAKQWDVRLISSLKDKREIPTEGNGLYIVADVKRVLHIRAFDRRGKMRGDHDETAYPEPARQKLWSEVASSWPPHVLSESEKERIRIILMERDDAPDEGRPVHTDRADSKLEMISEKLAECMKSVLVAFRTLDVEAAALAVTTARECAIEAGRLRDVAEHDRLAIRAMERLVVFFASHARMIVATKEGAFAEGRAEAQTTRRECDEFVAQLEQFFDAHDTTFETTGSDLHRLHGMFKLMTHLFAAAEEMATAEELGFQGRIAEYVQCLRRALRHHRQAVDTPLPGAELDDLIQPLRTLSVASIRLLQKRVTNFELRAKGEVPYLFPPSGKKVFIIHGHNEARRLELAILLKDDFGLDPIVLVDELSGMSPGARKVRRRGQRVRLCNSPAHPR